MQATASINPRIGSDAEAPQPPPIDWETERRQALILIPPLIIYIGGIFAILWGGSAVGLTGGTRAGLALAWMTGIPLLLAFVRWPGRLVQRHTLTIATSPERVWDTLHCRETDTYYRKPCARIEKEPGTDSRYIWHYGDAGYCCSCGLPRNQAHSNAHLHVEVVEQEIGRSARQISTFPDGTPFHCRLYRREENRFEILPHAEGAQVTYEICVVGARAWMLALMAADNIPRALLIDLKSHLEGTDGTGVFANGRRHAEYAAAAPKLCGCT